MANHGQMTLELKGDREIVITRELDAPRELVFDAFTKPELLKKWLFGPPGWSMVVCEMDVRPGGKYRWVWRNTDGREMGMGGVHREVVVPERIVNTQLFDEDWTGGEVIGTMVFKTLGPKTLLTNTLLYASSEARAMAMSTPMADGMEMGYCRLDAMFAAGV